MKKLLHHIGTGLGVIIFVGIGLLQCGTVEPSPPDNAIVFVDEDQKIYHSPQHFLNDQVEPSSNLKKSTYGEAKQSGLEKDGECRDRDYFIHKKGSILYVWAMEATGQQIRERWNADGSWNW